MSKSSKERKTELLKLAKNLIEEIRNDLQQAQGPWERSVVLRFFAEEPSDLRIEIQPSRVMALKKTTEQAAQRLARALRGDSPLALQGSKRKPFWSLPSQSKAPFNS